jgi:Coenzyme A transferase
VLEEAINADYALVYAQLGDTDGNLVFNKTAMNFNPLAALAETRRRKRCRTMPTCTSPSSPSGQPDAWVDGLTAMSLLSIAVTAGYTL